MFWWIHYLKWYRDPGTELRKEMVPDKWVSLRQDRILLTNRSLLGKEGREMVEGDLLDQGGNGDQREDPERRTWKRWDMGKGEVKRNTLYRSFQEGKG